MKNGRTALIYAAQEGRLQVVNSLIASGAKVGMTEKVSKSTQCREFIGLFQCVT